MRAAAYFAAAIGIFASAASASVQGFDISHYQPTVDFAKAYSAGARFVIIKVQSHLYFWPHFIALIFPYCRLPKAPHTLTPASAITIPKLQRRALFEADTTSHNQPLLPVRLRPTIFSEMEEVGHLMALLCPGCLILSMLPVATAVTDWAPVLWSAGSTTLSPLTMPLQPNILSSILPLAGGNCAQETVPRSVASHLWLLPDTPAPLAHYPMAGAFILFGKTATRLLGAVILTCLWEIYLSFRRLLAGVRNFRLGKTEELCS